MESNPTHKRKVVGFLLSLAGAIFLADSQKCVTIRSLLSLKAQQASAIWERRRSRERSARGGGVAVGGKEEGALEHWRGGAAKASPANKRLGRTGGGVRVGEEPADKSTELKRWREPKQIVA